MKDQSKNRYRTFQRRLGKSAASGLESSARLSTQQTKSFDRNVTKAFEDARESFEATLAKSMTGEKAAVELLAKTVSSAESTSKRGRLNYDADLAELISEAGVEHSRARTAMGDLADVAQSVDASAQSGISDPGGGGT